MFQLAEDDNIRQLTSHMYHK